MFHETLYWYEVPVKSALDQAVRPAVDELQLSTSRREGSAETEIEYMTANAASIWESCMLYEDSRSYNRNYHSRPLKVKRTQG